MDNRSPRSTSVSKLGVLLAFVLLFLASAHFIRHHRTLRADATRATTQQIENCANPTPDTATTSASESCATNNVGYRALTIAGRPVALWYPTAAQPASYSYNSNFSSTVAFQAPASTVCGRKVPLVLFSHGDFGCGLQSVAITEELARHAYVVAAPDHADAFLCHTVEEKGAPHRPAPQPSVFKPEIWDEKTFLDRRDDLEAVMSELLFNREFQQVIDPQSIGAAGHSLGGYTVVGLAGGWASWRDPRIHAVVAFSPYVMPFQVKKTLGGVHVPLMYQGGTLDVGITPFLQGKDGAFAAANPPVYFAVLPHAGHLALTNCSDNHTTASCLANTTNARLIADYTIAFFNHYLKSLPEPILEEPNPALADYKYRLPH